MPDVSLSATIEGSGTVLGDLSLPSVRKEFDFVHQNTVDGHFYYGRGIANDWFLDKIADGQGGIFPFEAASAFLTLPSGQKRLYGLSYRRRPILEVRFDGQSWESLPLEIPSVNDRVVRQVKAVSIQEDVYLVWTQYEGEVKDGNWTSVYIQKRSEDPCDKPFCVVSRLKGVDNFQVVVHGSDIHIVVNDGSGTRSGECRNLYHVVFDTSRRTKTRKVIRSGRGFGIFAVGLASDGEQLYLSSTYHTSEGVQWGFQTYDLTSLTWTDPQVIEYIPEDPHRAKGGIVIPLSQEGKLLFVLGDLTGLSFPEQNIAPLAPPYDPTFVVRFGFDLNGTQVDRGVLIPLHGTTRCLVYDRLNQTWSERSLPDLAGHVQYHGTSSEYTEISLASELETTLTTEASAHLLVNLEAQSIAEASSDVEVFIRQRWG
jgi:hypothetical protein